MNNRLLMIIVLCTTAVFTHCSQNNTLFTKVFGKYATNAQRATACISLALSTHLLFGSALSAYDGNIIAGPWQLLIGTGFASLSYLLYNKKTKLNAVWPICGGLIVRGLHELVFKKLIGVNPIYLHLPCFT